MKKDYKQKGTINPLKQGQVKAWLIVLLSVFYTCVSFPQMPTIKQGPWAKGVKLTNQAMYIGEDESCYYIFDCSIKTTVLGFSKTDLSLKVEKEYKSKLSVRFPHLWRCVRREHRVGYRKVRAGGLSPRKIHDKEVGHDVGLDR